ncbi:DUF4260 domain-containing protein [Rubrivirga marina]|uniref:DUF4260 domain-containing protein n=1 Tax=Rubrivirga marina TaxID=1196024 RepID=A0A271IWM4_9BACT|nr:DUF4260 domain-containing protein [Rubrivirga marina]PAP75338.1 hypothetical protein BSZ37_02195 [Rubrivirga marina]
MTRTLLRLEGLAALAVAVWGYALTGASWWLFVGLLFAPDLSAVGYLRGPHVGAAMYNAAHTYAVPTLLAAVAYSAGWALGLPVALVWAAHIGLDRALGYGLKLPDGFHQTHLGPIGPARRA